MVMAAWPSQTVMKRRRHLRNSSQNKFIELSRTGMGYQAKLLTIRPQIVSKKSYLSILVNNKF